MNNKEYPNLRPWQPGQSGNPAGRKPGSKNIATIVNELLEQEANTAMLKKGGIADLTQGASTSYAKAIVWATVLRAMGGDMRAVIWLAEQQERDFVGYEVERRPPIIVSNIMPRN